MTRFALLPAVLFACSSLLPNCALADSATWNTIPNDNQWNKPRNWTPATVPYGIHDVATFGASNVTDIMLGLTPHGDAGNRLSSVVFNPGASSYTITMTSVYGLPSFLEFHDGIVNNSGVTQNFVAAKSEISDSARIYFEGVSSAGQNVVITNQASVGVQYGAFTSFDASSTAGSATLVNEGADVSGTLWGGFTDLLFYSNAESATFISNPGTVSGGAAGHTLVQIYAPGSVGNSTFISNGANVAGAEGGWTEIDGTISAGATYVANGATVVDAQGGQVYTYGGDGYSYFIANGGDGTNAPGGLIDIAYVPASTETMVTANGGTDGGLGGIILIEGSADIPLPQFQVFGNGTLDLSNASGTVAIGSLSGNGLVLLDGHSLSVGNNNLDTTFSGAVEQGGTLIKDGTGTLTLSGANTQSGGTTINAGVLIAGTRNGSATGTGNVNVKAGTLGGNGAIAGAVTVGTGSGTGAFLEPSVGASKPAKLTIQSPLSFRADGTYTCKLNTKKAKADQLSANGVMIDSGAQFNFQPVANKKLTTGTVFSAINNTSATPISGVFANLPDGSTFTVGRNNYQVSYEGGDGNDLTLTVTPSP